MNNTGSRKWLVITLVWLLLLGAGAAVWKFVILPNNGGGGNPVGDDEPNDDKPHPVVFSGTLEVPFILWGGDAATFLANGGLETKPDTIFAKLGLKVKLTREDNFPRQVKNYLAGKTPFLRGTTSMLGEFSEKIGKDTNTRPVVFLQLTWSAGDHLVARRECRTMGDLKGKKIALQKYGPHVGMLDDILRTAKLKWDDIKVVWTDDVTGPKGPEALFRKDLTIDACFAITPDMLKLTDGLDKTGTGVKGTMDGAHVLVSTKNMSRSIADVYACRKDFFDQHRELVEKFAAGYLKACEELTDLKKNARDKYKGILKLTEEIYGKEDIPDEDAADGLIADAGFVLLPGNASFFTDDTNLSNFETKQKAALDLAVTLKDATTRYPFLKPEFDYARLKRIGDLETNLDEKRKVIDPTKFKLPTGANLTKNTLFSFEIKFDPNQKTFSKEKYGDQFKRAVEQASLFGKAVIAVRGHADIAEVMKAFVKAALAKGILTRMGSPGKYKYFLKNGDTLELSDTRKILALIDREDFSGGADDPRSLVKSLLQLSENRAREVKEEVLKYAEKKYRLDPSQIIAVGVGVEEPVVPVPRTDEQLARNRRVEFRIIKVSGEALTSRGLDY